MSMLHMSVFLMSFGDLCLYNGSGCVIIKFILNLRHRVENRCTSLSGNGGVILKLRRSRWVRKIYFVSDTPMKCSFGINEMYMRRGNSCP